VIAWRPLTVELSIRWHILGLSICSGDSLRMSIVFDSDIGHFVLPE
jgi:hypothetical protein